MDEPLKAKSAMEKTNLDGAPELAHHNQTFSSATNTGEKRKREGFASGERGIGDSSETKEVIIVGDTKAIKDFWFWWRRGASRVCV
ncbi:hypothetical protein YC2023_119399 [Brassica napus]